MISIKKHVAVEANLTVDHWQLYNIPGSEEAARGLNSELNRLVSEYNEINNQNAVNVHEEMLKCMLKYKKFGAYDTEPYWVLSDIIKSIYGYSPAY